MVIEVEEIIDDVEAPLDTPMADKIDTHVPMFDDFDWKDTLRHCINEITMKMLENTTYYFLK
eukprot:9022124-Ditylum_brightwellii.AAC.1